MLTLSALLAAALKLLLPALLLVALVDVLTQSQPQRIRRLYRSGNYSQRALAARLGVTRYAVRAALA
jgi:DNA-binding MarR family transcriptional regulator